MRSSIAALIPKLSSSFFALALAFGLMPAAAYAEPAEDASASPEAEEPAAETTAAADEEQPMPIPAGEIINQEMPLDSVVAQAESTRTFFLAQTLESTKTVPVVSAKLPLGGEAADEVVGSFEHLGMTFAVEPGGGSVALVAADPAKLPQEFLDARSIAVPAAVSPDDIDSYSVTRIAEGAFASVGDTVEAVGVPASVTEVADGAFAGASAVRYVVVSDDNPVYRGFDGCLYSADLTSLLLIPEGRLGAVRVAPSATSIDPAGFSHCPLDTIIADADSAAFQLLEGDDIYNSKGDRVQVIDSATAAEEGIESDFDAGGYEETLYGLNAALKTASYADCDDDEKAFDHDDWNVRLSHRIGSGSVNIAGLASGTTIISGSFRYTATSTYTSVGYGCETSACAVSKSFGTGSNFTSSGVSTYSSYALWWCSDGYLCFGFCVATGNSAPAPTHVYPIYHFAPATANTYVQSAEINGQTFAFGSSLSALSGKTITSIKLNPTTVQPGKALTITWNSNGGSSVSSWSVSSGGSLANNTGGATSLPAPTRSGWIFDGWYTSNSSFTSSTKLSTTLSSTTPAADTTYYARWRIAFNWYAHGSTAGASQTVKYSPGDYGTSTAYSSVSATSPSSSSNVPTGWSLYRWSRSSSADSSSVSPGSAAAAYSTSGTNSYYARWQALIKQNLNNGSSAVTNLTTLYASGSSPTATYKPSDPTRSGYTFAGWNVDYESSSIADDNSKYKNTTITFKGAATLVAQWTVNRYTVTWNSSGGSPESVTTIADGGTAHTAPVQGTGSGQVQLSGWTLEGWYTDQACTAGRVAPGASTGAVSADTAYYARWTRAVAFEPQNGSAAISVTASRTAADTTGTLTTPAAPTREGWTFKGWTTSPEGTSYTAASTAATSSAATWYARWEMTLTLNAEGGTASATSFTALNAGASPFYNVSAIALPTPSRTGYTFKGWYADAAASGERLDDSTGTASGSIAAGKLAGSQTIHAGWTVNTYRLTWDVPHGTNPNSAVTFTVADCPLQVSAAVPFSGYAFMGWSGPGISGSPRTFAITDQFLVGRADGDTLAYAAAFSANAYTVTLHVNDGTGSDGLGASSSFSAVYDAAVNAVDVPKRYGYVFAGYYAKDADGGKGERYFDASGTFAKASVWNDTQDTDLYACWTLMASLEVPVATPDAVTLGVDRATEVSDDATGVPAGASVTGVVRSAVPQEVPIASIELEALQDADGTSVAERVLGTGNPEACAVEVAFGSSTSAILRLAVSAGSVDASVWRPAPGARPAIPAAAPVASGTIGDDVVADDLGSLARMGELPLAYTMRLLPGFDALKMPSADATGEPVARIVFTVDLTELDQEQF